MFRALFTTPGVWALIILALSFTVGCPVWVAIVAFWHTVLNTFAVLFQAAVGLRQGYRVPIF